jgi:hypothetical protein
MRRIAAGAIVGAGLVAVLAALVSTPGDARRRHLAAAPQSLCKQGEQVLFQCRVDRRTAALCAGAGPEGRFVQYRFGRPGALELAFPERGSAGLSRARTAYSGGGELQVNFRTGGHLYVLYSRTVRTGFGAEGNQPDFQAGIAVVRGKRMISDRRCTDADDFASSPDDLLPQGEFTRWWDLED